MVSRYFRVAALIFVASLALTSCSEDNPAEPAGDTTAPVVVGAIPAQNQTDVNLGQAITISFDEDMAADSAAGHVTLSQGTVTSTSWTDARHLVVEHTDWAEGVQVTVTVSTHLTDLAGNGLAEAFAWSFWTWTDAVLLQDTSPAQGATNVPINTQIWLRFTEAMNGATLPAAITVSSAAKAVLPYALAGSADNAEWTLAMDADLPAATVITVTITTAAESAGGHPLATPAEFSFTTGTGADLTPPHLVAVEPANGAAIGTDVAVVRLTFDEPILDDSLQPSLISGQFMISLASFEGSGVWTENQTVLTIGLRTPLVPGAVFRVEFDSYADVHGNVNEDGFVWQVTVAGAAQHYPVRDGWVQYYSGTFEETGPSGSSGSLEGFTKLETRTGGEFWLWNYDHYQSNPAKDLPVFVQYDRLQATTSAILMQGFHEVNDGQPVDGVFSPAIEWLRLPVEPGSWSGSASFVQGTDNLQLAYGATVLPGTFNVAVAGGGNGPPMSWLDCRKVALHYEVGDGTTIFNAGADTLWYAPGAGLVREKTREEREGLVHTADKVLQWAGPAADWPQN